MEHEARIKTSAMWGMGDYDLLADRLAPAAQTIASLAGAGDARTAVDLAAGTGRLAVGLSEGGWQVSAVDIAPALIAIGEKMSRALGHVIGWHEAPFDELPFEDDSFDLAASSFGLIFAADTPQVLAEARRVLVPGGDLIFSAWTPTSYIAQMTDVMAKFVPSDVPMDAPFLWGDLAVQHGWLSEHFTVIDSSVHTLPWVFGSPVEASDFMFTCSPAHVATFEMAGEHGPAMRAAVRDHLTSVVGGPGPVDIDAEYVITRARSR